MIRKSYIVSNYKVSKSTYRFVHGKLKDVSPEHRRFFLHVLCSHLLDLARERYEILSGWDTLGINLPSVTIKAEFERGFSWHPLRDQGLIEASDYHDGECRYFQVTPPLFHEILTHVQQQIASPDGSPAVNLFSGMAYDITHAVSGEGARPSSKLMRDALRILHVVDCPINVEAIQQHLIRLEAEGKPLALQNDKLCAQTLFAGMKSQRDLRLYTPSYSPQSSGRIGELGGGVQSCSRAMKDAAFTGIENVHNYDLRSSQGYVLLQELRLAGIDDSWLAAHLGPGAFEQRADQLDLPKKLYKKCFFSTIMGATHIWLDEEHVKHVGAIQEGMLAHFDTRRAAHQKFGEVVAQLHPLQQVVRQWSEWLLNDPACLHRKKTQRREYLENAAGQKYLIDRARAEKDLKGEGAAHMLQGQEAAYIHQLTLLSKDYGFLPASNQHDGLITLGFVPDEAKGMAAQRSGFQHAFLEEKALL